MMIRTIINVSKKDKLWLKQTSEKLGISMAELIRRAIGAYQNILTYGFTDIENHKTVTYPHKTQNNESDS